MTTRRNVKKRSPGATDQADFFWELVEPLLVQEAISRSTMMGYPCLRVNGAFFASTDRQTGDLIVKLPEQRVDDLIDAGIGRPFAPAGRRFRQWVTVPERDAERWRSLLNEARAHVEAGAR